jgi:hydroxyacyl-ACP dehydratase HTD2-like protein with hotdog domain
LYNHDNTLTATMEFQYSQLQFNFRITTQVFTMVLHVQDGASTGMELLITHVDITHNSTSTFIMILVYSRWCFNTHDASSHSLINHDATY